MLSTALLATRLPLARILSPLQKSTIDKLDVQSEPSQLPTDVLASADEGFTGGIIGVLRPRRALIPERWLQELGQPGIAVVTRRRELAVKTGSWARGRLLALAFTLLGVVLAAFVVGPARIGTGEGIITFSFVFTLWSFIGLLTLPTPSRAGVAEVDAGLRASGIDPAVIDETIRNLDTLQDAEQERPVGVEAIFHPVPSVRSRIEGPMNRNPRGFLDAARTSVFLSAAGLGLLGRAVHCNCGRPALWIFLPSD
jgi:hypothetical protein